MKFLANGYIVILVLFILNACEEGSAIKKEDTNIQNLKVKKFLAKSAVPVYSGNTLQVTSGKSLVGRRTIKDALGNPLYIMRVRPIYRFALDSGATFRYKDTNGNLTDNLKLYGKHKFVFRGDSLKSDRDFYNKDFNQKMNLKAFVESINDSTVYHKSNTLWTNSRFGRFEDPLNTKVIPMGESSNIVNSASKIRPLNEISIENNNLEKLFTRSVINGFNIFPINSFVLDYTQEQDGLYTIDSLPQLLINVYNDTLGKPSDTLTITASSTMYSWISYEKIAGPADNLHILRNADREAIKINFDADSINNFTKSHKIFSAALNFKFNNPTNLPLATLTATSILTIKEKEISTYNDNLPEFETSIFTLSGLLFEKNSNQILSTKLNTTNTERLFTSYLRNWQLNIGVLGSVYLFPSLGFEPGVTIFNKDIVSDSTFVLKIYYSDLEN